MPILIHVSSWPYSNCKGTKALGYKIWAAIKWSVLNRVVEVWWISLTKAGEYKPLIPWDQHCHWEHTCRYSFLSGILNLLKLSFDIWVLCSVQKGSFTFSRVTLVFIMIIIIKKICTTEWMWPKLKSRTPLQMSLEWDVRQVVLEVSLE